MARQTSSIFDVAADAARSIRNWRAGRVAVIAAPDGFEVQTLALECTKPCIVKVVMGHCPRCHRPIHFALSKPRAMRTLEPVPTTEKTLAGFDMDAPVPKGAIKCKPPKAKSNL